MALSLVKVSTVLTALLAATLGSFTLFRNPKSTINRLWFATSMAVTVWSGGYLLTIYTSDADVAQTYLRVVYTGATLIPILYFHFLTNFLLKRKTPLLIAGYLIALVFLFLVNFTNLIIVGVRYLPWFGYYENPGGVPFYLYLAYFFFFTLYSMHLLFISYLQQDGFRKRQIFFFILATIIGLGGGITNFVMDLTGVFPYGQLVVFLYPLLITYGIFLPSVKVKV